MLIPLFTNFGFESLEIEPYFVNALFDIGEIDAIHQLFSNTPNICT